jgi:hypothetical protein
MIVAEYEGTPMTFSYEVDDVAARLARGERP